MTYYDSAAALVKVLSVDGQLQAINCIIMSQPKGVSLKQARHPDKIYFFYNFNLFKSINKKNAILNVYVTYLEIHTPFVKFFITSRSNTFFTELIHIKKIV